MRLFKFPGWQLITVLLSLGFGTHAFGGSGFGAPSISGHTNVNSPEYGDIVLDVSDGSFWGYSYNGSTAQWSQFLSSTSYTAMTITQLNGTTGTNETYTPPANVLYLKLRMVGAGGGGGGVTNVSYTGGGGGGAGGYIENIISSPSGTYTYQLGTVGTSGTNTGGSGGLGGSTWFNGSTCAGATVCAAGGSGGTGSTSGPVNGGAGGGSTVNGLVNIPGGHGAMSSAFASSGIGGQGGDSAFGGGGNGGSGSGILPGNGSAYGSGGGGGGAQGGAQAGATGAQGYIIVEEHYQ